jgi:hypothetical protein
MHFVYRFLMQIVWLLWWNTGNDIHFAEFHIVKYFKNVHRNLSGTSFFPQAKVEREKQRLGDAVTATQGNSYLR